MKIFGREGACRPLERDGHGGLVFSGSDCLDRNEAVSLHSVRDGGRQDRIGVHGRTGSSEGKRRRYG